MYNKQMEVGHILDSVNSARTVHTMTPKAIVDEVCHMNQVPEYHPNQLTVHQKAVLENGLNLVPAPRVIPVPKIVATVENALTKVGETRAAEQARIRITNLLRKAKQQAPNILPEQTRAIRELRNKDSGLAILPAEKGCVTVAMDRVEYDKKTRETHGIFLLSFKV